MNGFDDQEGKHCLWKRKRKPEEGTSHCCKHPYQRSIGASIQMRRRWSRPTTPSPPPFHEASPQRSLRPSPAHPSSSTSSGIGATWRVLSKAIPQLVNWWSSMASPFLRSFIINLYIYIYLYVQLIIMRIQYMLMHIYISIQVDENSKIVRVEFFYDRGELLAGLVKDGVADTSASGCPVLRNIGQNSIQNVKTLLWILCNNINMGVMKNRVLGFHPKASQAYLTYLEYSTIINWVMLTIFWPNSIDVPLPDTQVEIFKIVYDIKVLFSFVEI